MLALSPILMGRVLGLIQKDYSMLFRNTALVLTLVIALIACNTAAAQITGDITIFTKKVNGVAGTSYNAGDTCYERAVALLDCPVGTPGKVVKLDIAVYDSNCNLLAIAVASCTLESGTTDTVDVEYTWFAPNPLNGQHFYYTMITLYYNDAMMMPVILDSDDAEFSHPTM